MIRRTYFFGILTIMAALFLNSCEFHEHHYLPPPPPVSNLEVTVTHAISGYPMPGVEVTLYHTYEDAFHYRYPVASLLTDPYGVAYFNQLPAGRIYFARAQGPLGFSLGEVFMDGEGLYILPMQLQ